MTQIKVEKVESYKITIGGQLISLTENEARELHAKLGAVFPSSIGPYYPNTAPHYPWDPNLPYKITCDAKGLTK